jgi:hypothetical protein
MRRTCFEMGCGRSNRLLLNRRWSRVREHMVSVRRLTTYTRDQRGVMELHNSIEWSTHLPPIQTHRKARR